MKSCFPLKCTVYRCAWQIDCLTYDMIYATVFPICNEKLEKHFSDLYISKAFWLIEKPCRNNHLVCSYWTHPGCCLMHEVLVYRSWPHGFWNLRVDHHVSFSLDSPPQWEVESCSSSSSIDSYIFSWFSPRWKEIMSFVRAISEHQSFIRKDRSLWLFNHSQLARYYCVSKMSQPLALQWSWE